MYCPYVKVRGICPSSRCPVHTIQTLYQQRETKRVQFAEVVRTELRGYPHKEEMVYTQETSGNWKLAINIESGFILVE